MAEFSVASSPSATSKEEDESDLEGDKIVRPNKEYSICTDPVRPNNYSVKPSVPRTFNSLEAGL